jgi:hypothetical protein
MKPCLIPRPCQTIALLAAAWLLVMAGGCGGDALPKVKEDQKLRGLIPAVRESAESAARFKTIFVEGAVPADAELPRYRKYAYEINAMNASGDEATVTVAVRSIPSGKKVGSGEIVGEVEWTAVKSGDEWKLKNAPLPAAAK